MAIISENISRIEIESTQKINRSMEIFYNPAMESHRNISILLLNSIENERMNLADPLAGSGIRSIRFLQELKRNKINHLFVNDKKENFTWMFKKNLQLNNLNLGRVSVYNEEASLFLLNRVNDQNKPLDFCGYFDYIEIDPFGSPNPFLSAAIARISRSGVLAVTATDTAALTGTYPKTTFRKYWASNYFNYMMHELGLRILIRKIQLQALQFDKALTPILAYFKDHYFRVYFRSGKGKSICNELLKQHQYLLYNPKTLDWEISPHNYKRNFAAIGPLWAGNVFDKELIKKMIINNKFESEQAFLERLNAEKDQVGFYDLHEMARKYKLAAPKLEKILKKTKGTRTHFSSTGIKTNKSLKEILKLMAACD